MILIVIFQGVPAWVLAGCMQVSFVQTGRLLSAQQRVSLGVIDTGVTNVVERGHAQCCPLSNVMLVNLLSHNYRALANVRGENAHWHRTGIVVGGFTTNIRTNRSYAYHRSQHFYDFYQKCHCSMDGPPSPLLPTYMVKLADMDVCGSSTTLCQMISVLVYFCCIHIERPLLKLLGPLA